MDTTSEEHLSGDEMWDEASVQTVEGFVNSIYTEFSTATMQKSCYILYSGDLRCAPLETDGAADFVKDLVSNDLNGLQEHYSDLNDVRAAEYIMQWKNFYKVIQSANILLKEIDRTSVPENE